MLTSSVSTFFMAPSLDRLLSFKLFYSSYRLLGFLSLFLQLIDILFGRGPVSRARSPSTCPCMLQAGVASLIAKSSQDIRGHFLAWGNVSLCQRSLTVVGIGGRSWAALRGELGPCLTKQRPSVKYVTEWITCRGGVCTVSGLIQDLFRMHPGNQIAACWS